MRQYYPLMPAQSGDQGEQGRPEPPDYKVYRSRPGLLSRLRSPDLSALRERVSGKGKGPTRPAAEKEPAVRPPWRRVLKWVGIAALAWIVLSFLAFAVSSLSGCPCRGRGSSADWTSAQASLRGRTRPRRRAA